MYSVWVLCKFFLIISSHICQLLPAITVLVYTLTVTTHYHVTMMIITWQWWLSHGYSQVNWGEPERTPHYRGLRDHVHWPTDRVRPTHDALHVPMLPRRHATHVNRCGDSYMTENTDDGKAKSRDTHTMNCKARARERPANLFILALPCRYRHASLGFTYVSFSRQLLHTNPF